MSKTLFKLKKPAHIKTAYIFYGENYINNLEDANDIKAIIDRLEKDKVKAEVHLYPCGHAEGGGTMVQMHKPNGGGAFVLTGKYTKRNTVGLRSFANKCKSGEQIWA